MLPTSHDGRAPGASSGEAQEEHASDDKSRDGIARALFRTTGRIQCEVCLRVKPMLHSDPQLRQYGRTFGRATIQSVAWRTNYPDEPRGSTIWKCVECSLAIDSDHSNWQERIALFGKARGQIYSSAPNQPAEFHRPRDADTAQD